MLEVHRPGLIKPPPFLIARRPPLEAVVDYERVNYARRRPHYDEALRFVRSPSVVAIAQTAFPAGVNSSSGVATYSTVAITTPSKVVVLCFNEAATSYDACTIDFGSGDTAMNAATLNRAQGSMNGRAFELDVASGTSATFKVTCGGDVLSTNARIAVYAVTGAHATLDGSGTDASTDMDVTDPLSTGSTTIPTRGGMLAGAGGATDTVAKDWANLTEDIDSDAGTFRFTTAVSMTEGTATRTCTGTTNGEDGVLVWLSFDPAE
jgi:hypothetical protein